MDDITRWAGNALLGSSSREPLAPRLPRYVQRTLDHDAERGLIAGGRAQADGYAAASRVVAAEDVARYGLRRVAELSAEEALYNQQAPDGAARYQVIVDSFTAVVANQVARVGEGR